MGTFQSSRAWMVAIQLRKRYTLKRIPVADFRFWDRERRYGMAPAGTVQQGEWDVLLQGRRDSICLLKIR